MGWALDLPACLAWNSLWVAAEAEAWLHVATLACSAGLPQVASDTQFRSEVWGFKDVFELLSSSSWVVAKEGLTEEQGAPGEHLGSYARHWEEDVVEDSGHKAGPGGVGFQA